MIGALDAVEPGLWRKVFEEYLYEWLDVIQGHDLSTMPRGDADRHQFETSSYVPVPWPGGGAKFFDRPDEIHADALYRLLPLLPSEGIDEMLLTDIVEWCKLAWPLGAWDSLFTPANLYAENFEDGLSDFDVTAAALATTAIKDANYVNFSSNVPANGGGKYVADRGINPDVTRQGINDTISVALAGTTRLKLKARVAFRDNDGIDPGEVHFKMRIRFGSDPTTYDAEDTLTLDPDLYDTEFETYESHLDVPPGATDITWLAVWWERVGGAGAGYRLCRQHPPPPRRRNPRHHRPRRPRS